MKAPTKSGKFIINVNFLKNGKRIDVVILRQKQRFIFDRTQRGY